MAHPLDLLRHHVSGAITRGEAQPVAALELTAAIHPAFTDADVARMSPAELAHFTDTPVAHVAAFDDFQRLQRIERRNRELVRDTFDRFHSARRLAALAWA